MVGGASPVPADPNAMGGAAPMDPNMMGGADMNGDGMPDDPNMMGGADMNGDGMPDDPNAAMPAEEGNDIQGIYDGLNDDHKKAVRKYARAMEDMEAENAEGGAPMDPNAIGGAPMQESFIFTKGQLKKINEVFGTEDMEMKKPEEKTLKDKKDRGYKKGSPFDAPRFE